MKEFEEILRALTRALGYRPAPQSVREIAQEPSDFTVDGYVGGEAAESWTRVYHTLVYCLDTRHYYDVVLERQEIRAAGTAELLRWVGIEDNVSSEESWEADYPTYQLCGSATSDALYDAEHLYVPSSPSAEVRR